MKKVLVFLSMVFVAQGLLLANQSERLQRKYLNRLHESSEIKSKCEKFAWLNKCDQMENEFATFAQLIRDDLKEASQNQSIDIEKVLNEIYFKAACVLDLNPKYKQDELKYVQSLGGDILVEEMTNDLKSWCKDSKSWCKK